jgi:hypothetical protein
MAGIDSFTKLMLHNNRFNETKAQVITANGDAKLSTSEYKFGSSSLVLDGTGDNLSFSNDDDFHFGSDDFTIDFWVKFNVLDTTQRLYGDSDAGDNFLSLRITKAGSSLQNRISCIFYNGSTTYSILSTTEMNTSDWWHITFIRTGNTLKLFVNGIQEGGDISITGSLGTKQSSYRIGTHGALTTNMLNGYIDEFRISKGIARWTSNFTPEIKPYKSDTNTVLLCHFQGANNSTTMIDAAGGDESGTHKLVTYNGDAQIVTAQNKFGGASAFFDGSGDYFTIPDSDDWFFDTGDFTIDFWVRPVISTYIAIFGQGTNFGADAFGMASTPSTGYIQVYARISGSYSYNLEVSSSDLNQNVWTHVAIVRNSGTSMIFINGVSQTLATNTSGSIPNQSVTFDIGRGATGPAFNGYIDEFRISKGIARWTSNFTPPTTEYSEVSGARPFSRGYIIG